MEIKILQIQQCLYNHAKYFNKYDINILAEYYIVEDDQEWTADVFRMRI